MRVFDGESFKTNFGLPRTVVHHWLHWGARLAAVDFG